MPRFPTINTKPERGDSYEHHYKSIPSLDKGIYGRKRLFCGSAALLSLAVPPGTPRSKALHIRKTADFQLCDFFSA